MSARMKSALVRVARHALAIVADALPHGRFNPRMKPAWRLVLGAAAVLLVILARRSAEPS